MTLSDSLLGVFAAVHNRIALLTLPQDERSENAYGNEAHVLLKELRAACERLVQENIELRRNNADKPNSSLLTPEEQL